MTTIDLDLPFKGDRNYLHGTDMLDALLDAFGTNKRLDFQIHQVTKQPLRILSVSDDIQIEDCVAKSLIGDKIALLVRRNGEVQRRRPYDEAAAIDGHRRREDFLENDRIRDFSLVEQIVALNKQHLTELFSNVQNWYFTKLSADVFPADVRRIAVRFDRSIGNKLYRSQLLADGAQIGHIGFSPSIQST